jgi:hypothetical protein
VTRATDDPTTLRWFRLSDLRRHGWGELRIRDALKRARPEHWRGYPQLEISEIDWANTATNINCEVDTADITRAGREPGDPMLWTERIEELALLLPADADGAPLSPEDAQAALALPVDISSAPTDLSKVPRSKRPPTQAWQRTEIILKKLFEHGVPPEHEVSDADIINAIEGEWKVLPNPLHVKLPSPNTLRAVIKQQRALTNPPAS